MAMNKSQAVFRYKTIKGPLHRVPALLKLILLLPLSIFCMSLSPKWLCVGIILSSITAFLCRFTLREQFTDLVPAFFYAALMYALSVFSNLFELFGKITLNANIIDNLVFILMPRYDFLHIALRLVLIVQLSALLFRTTSALEIRESLRIEPISLFLSFIPLIFETWKTVDLAWKARGGRQGLRKIRTIVFVLILLSMEKAAMKSMALTARKGGKYEK
jgi:biotin transport system permease protein/energy-coupling factor transport system permease protein